MSQILDYALVQPPHGITVPMPSCAWVILDCGHWYKWSGRELPAREKDFPCPNCAPLPKLASRASQEQP